MNDPAPSLAPFRLSLARMRLVDRASRALYALAPVVMLTGYVIDEWRVSHAGLGLGVLALGIYIRRLSAAVVARFLANVADLVTPLDPDSPDAAPTIPAPRNGEPDPEPETTPDPGPDSEPTTTDHDADDRPNDRHG